jgi:CBS domain-containing protein
VVAESRGVRPARTVAEAMVRRPVVHPASLTVAEARHALDDPHRHMLLIVSGGRLLGTVTRDDVAGTTDDAAPALTCARLVGRLAQPHQPLEPLQDAMVRAGERRRAVVDEHGVLLGLLCLKASASGFCTDAGIAARRASVHLAPRPTR